MSLWKSDDNISLNLFDKCLIITEGVYIYTIVYNRKYDILL